MRATIKQKTIIAENTLDVVFDLGSQEIKFLPGQFFFLKLIRPPFNDGRGAERHFSFINSPDQKNIIEMATRLTGSAFKKSLEKLPLKTAVEIGPIAGEFLLPADSNQPLVFIAGGIGITPFISMLRFIAAQKLNHEITLLYFNRTQASTAFYQELLKLKRKIAKLEIVFSMNEDAAWKGEASPLSPALIKKYLPNYLAQKYFLAGPPAMVKSALQALRDLKIKKGNIQAESFTGYK